MFLLVVTLILPLVNGCTDPRDKGFNCDSASSGMRFYHDAKSGRCQPFFFQGCGGNPNNFADRQSCESNCTSGSKSTPTSAAAKNDTIITSCSLKTAAVLLEPAAACRTTADCAAGHSCNSAGSCCPTKEHICSLTPSNGNEAKEFVHRPKFSYFGVNGNPNNFPSYKECIAFCGVQ